MPRLGNLEMGTEIAGTPSYHKGQSPSDRTGILIRSGGDKELSPEKVHRRKAMQGQSEKVPHVR